MHASFPTRSRQSPPGIGHQLYGRVAQLVQSSGIIPRRLSVRPRPLLPALEGRRILVCRTCLLNKTGTQKAGESSNLSPSASIWTNGRRGQCAGLKNRRFQSDSGFVHHGIVAQLIERRDGIAEVEGLTPFYSTTFPTSLQGGAAWLARQPHKLEVLGSSPSPASNL